MEEIWKDVYEYEGLYHVSNLGNIKSLDKTVKSGIKNQETRFIKGKLLNFASDKDGYLQVSMTRNGKRKKYRVHRIVCFAFHLNIENKPQVNHKDGIKFHNYEWNLEWSTLSENRTHAYKTGLQNGLQRRGEKSNFVKLTSEQIVKIRNEYVPYKIKQKFLAEKYGVTQSAISSIINKRNWNYL